MTLPWAFYTLQMKTPFAHITVYKAVSRQSSVTTSRISKLAGNIILSTEIFYGYQGCTFKVSGPGFTISS